MYRKIDPRIWNDSKFHSLSNEGKLIFFYLLTAPRLARMGALPMTKSALLEEVSAGCATRCPTPWQTGLNELLGHGVVHYDERGLFWVKNFLKFNPPDNPSVVKAWQIDFEVLPECPLLVEIVENARKICESKGFAFLKSFDSLTIPNMGVAHGVEHGVEHGVTHPVAHQEARSKKQEKKEIKKETALFDLTRPQDCSEEIWSEWLTYRKQMKKPFNAHGLKLLQTEAQKAKVTTEKAMTLAMASNWVSFKAAYVANANVNTQANDTASRFKQLQSQSQRDNVHRPDELPIGLEEALNAYA